jgi:hypothetical protein
VPLDQRVRELPLRVRERYAVPLERGLSGARRTQRLAFEGKARYTLLKRFDADSPSFPSETRRCDRPQSRNTHPDRSIGSGA